MKNQKQIFTQEGYNKIQEEILERETEVRTKIADEIEKARQQGDLSENAAYKAAIEAKEFNENRISQLKEQLSKAEITSNTNTSVVGLARHVIIQNEENGSEIEYQIVGHNEANPAEKKISLDSPLGQALAGKSKGESVSVTTPNGLAKFTIKSIK